MVEWNGINWRKLEKNVYKLQKRIFQASLRGDTKAVRRLQKVFSATRDGKVAETLINHASKPIVRHIKVKGTASPFDGNLKYWSSRRGEHPLVTTRVAKLLKEQKGKCAYCGLYFREDDLIEVDHIIPTTKGGKDRYGNLQALHRHCHDSKTANDGSRGTHDKSQIIEEPCKVKVCAVIRTE